MTNEERLKAAGWRWDDPSPGRWIGRDWTRDGLHWHSEAEALVVVLTAERDAAIARAERAEADNDALRKQIATRTEALQTANGTNAAMRARAEAAEALAASRPEITPALAGQYIDVAPGSGSAVMSALRAHAAKVRR